MVSEASSGRIVHAAFREIARFLEPGDLLVVNDQRDDAGGAVRAA